MQALQRPVADAAAVRRDQPAIGGPGVQWRTVAVPNVEVVEDGANAVADALARMKHAGASTASYANKPLCHAIVTWSIMMTSDVCLHVIIP